MSTTSSHMPDTFFAPAARASADALSALADAALSSPLIQVVLDAVQGYMLILNEQRQILAANYGLLDALNIRDAREILGLRPGELLRCENAHVGPGGCGTSERCSKCGAVLTVMACQETRQPADGECTLSMVRDGHVAAGEFHVRCTPLELAGQPVTAVVLQDISAVKRRDVLERVFIHDLRNVLHGLMGYSELINADHPDAAARMVVALSNQLNEEIDAQDLLLRGETGTLFVATSLTSGSSILERVAAVFKHHAASQGKQLETDAIEHDIILETDTRLLTRVLVNMTKNAFEAIPKGSTVRIGFAIRNALPVFYVWDAIPIPRGTALQIFQRSFSTKASSGRGLGTYSMKLLGEQYLKGHISFSTSEADGTEFSITLPAESHHHLHAEAG